MIPFFTFITLNHRFSIFKFTSANTIQIFIMNNKFFFTDIFSIYLFLLFYLIPLPNFFHHQHISQFGLFLMRISFLHISSSSSPYFLIYFIGQIIIIILINKMIPNFICGCYKTLIKGYYIKTYLIQFVSYIFRYFF